jgi:hypothetical protein
MNHDLGAAGRDAGSDGVQAAKGRSNPGAGEPVQHVGGPREQPARVARMTFPEERRGGQVLLRARPQFVLHRARGGVLVPRFVEGDEVGEIGIIEAVVRHVVFSQGAAGLRAV